MRNSSRGTRRERLPNGNQPGDFSEALQELVSSIDDDLVSELYDDLVWELQAAGADEAETSHRRGRGWNSKTRSPLPQRGWLQNGNPPRSEEHTSELQSP